MIFTERWHTFFDRSAPNMILRFAVMFFGLALVAASVALTRASGLGTSPISCIPAVLSFTTAWTIGTWTFVANVLFVLIQIILLRSDFNPIQFLQIAFVFVFSAMIDFFVPFCELIPMPNYGFELFYTILGVFMTGFGIFLQVKASLITLPGEGIVLAVSKVTKIAFPKCKVAFDTSQGVIGVIISLIAMGGLFGVREGTILSATVRRRGRESLQQAASELRKSRSARWTPDAHRNHSRGALKCKRAPRSPRYRCGSRSSTRSNRRFLLS